MYEIEEISKKYYLIYKIYHKCLKRNNNIGLSSQKMIRRKLFGTRNLLTLKKIQSYINKECRGLVGRATSLLNMSFY